LPASGGGYSSAYYIPYQTGVDAAGNLAPAAGVTGVTLDEGKLRDVLLLATGSEVPLCVGAYERLTGEGVKARVVGMPSWEVFEHYCRKHPEYRESVLPAAVSARVSVEQAATFGWERYLGASGHSIGMRTFGASAPLKELQ